MKSTLIGSLFAALCLAQPSLAQTYPTKAIRMIVPLAAGTGTDQMTRVLAQRMGEDLGQQVVVENRPGAGATIGTEIASRAAPDGYTLYMGGSVALTISPALYRKVAYDPAGSFTAVALISRFYLGLLVHPSLPAKNIKDLVALARARPDELVIASGGSGTTSHLTGALFQSMSKTRLLHVPYKGGGASLVAIMTGEAQLAFTPVALATQNVQGGKLRLLGVSSPRRLASLPDLPAIAESMPGFEWSGWQVLMVPAGTTPAISKRLHASVQKALASQEFLGYLAREGSEPFDHPPEHFPQFLAAEIAKNAHLVKISGARVD